MTVQKTRSHCDNLAHRLESSGWPVWLLLFAVAVAAFRQCLTLPLIQDDWSVLELSLAHDMSTLLHSFFDFNGKLMYRPASFSYLALLFKAFGEIAWPGHVVALSLHVLNSLMVLHIINKLTDDRIIAISCSLIYASAVAIHLDSLCWAVGIYDIAGAFFFFGAIALFLSGRTFASSLCFLAGILFKESIVVLPMLLAAVEWTRIDNWSAPAARVLLRRLLPHCCIMLAVLGVKVFAGASPLALPPSHPYFFDPLGEHILKNAYRYGGWMLQAILPFGSIDSSLFRFILGGLVALAIIAGSIGRKKSTKLLAGLSLWIILSILPVLFMPNHSYRYYAIYALPAFICIVLIITRKVLNLSGLRRHGSTLLASLVAASVFISIIQSNRIFAEGLDTQTMADGTNVLIRRAIYVNLVRQQLPPLLPEPADDAILAFEGLDIWSFHKNSGPRVWYNRPDLAVYDVKDLRYDDTGFFLENPVRTRIEPFTGPRPDKILLEAENLHAFTLKDRTLLPIPEKELAEIAARQTTAGPSPGHTQ